MTKTLNQAGQSGPDVIQVIYLMLGRTITKFELLYSLGNQLRFSPPPFLLLLLLFFLLLNLQTKYTNLFNSFVVIYLSESMK